MLIGTGMDLSVLNPFDPANPEGLLVAAFLLVMAIGGKVAAGWSYLSKVPIFRPFEPDPGGSARRGRCAGR